MRIALLLILCTTLLPASEPFGKLRLVWETDPHSSARLLWEQDGSLGAATLHYGTIDHGPQVADYPQELQAAVEQVRGMHTGQAFLQGLAPDTRYYGILSAGPAVSRRFWFRTAPDSPQPITIIAGGDSRNHRDARQRANTVVARLRPLCVAFAGDMTNRDTDREWQEWLDDWQLTIPEDGQLIPIVPARGNHEKSPASIPELFGIRSPGSYFAASIGGDLLRLYTLNSEISADGAQADWLASDLRTAGDHTWRIAQYHKPMRPHVARKKEGHEIYHAWAGLFHQHDLQLAIECDSHCVKTTWPIRPDTGPDSHEGFVRDDESGTVYIGEGCWGAPLRPADDAKPWTRASGSFNQVKWIHIAPERIEVRTIPIDDLTVIPQLAPADTLSVPPGLPLWPATDPVVQVLPRQAALSP